LLPGESRAPGKRLAETGARESPTRNRTRWRPAARWRNLSRKIEGRNLDMDVREDRRLHDAMDFIGLRALATAAGMIQMCTELRRAGVFDDEAIGRVKEAMAREIALSHRGNFETELKTAMQRLDALFAGREELRR
jgi:hypothetical protein